ncbi:FtsX-like permease family protein [Alteromonas sp. CYL-A6]|uniref:FtsX-like permease family protein n=1 Tax=Alteromonas nitratireducens TaxID=3390813 RepID=UPI0034B84FBB
MSALRGLWHLFRIQLKSRDTLFLFLTLFSIAYFLAVINLSAAPVKQLLADNLSLVFAAQEKGHLLADAVRMAKAFIDLIALSLFVLGGITLTFIGSRLAVSNTYLFTVCLVNGVSKRRCVLFHIVILTFIGTAALIFAAALSIITWRVLCSAANAFSFPLSSHYESRYLLDVLMMCFLAYAITQLSNVIFFLKLQHSNLINANANQGESTWGLYAFVISGLLLCAGFYVGNWQITSFLIGLTLVCLLFLFVTTKLFLLVAKRKFLSKWRLLYLSVGMVSKRIDGNLPYIIVVCLSVTILILSLRITDDILHVLNPTISLVESELSQINSRHVVHGSKLQEFGYLVLTIVLIFSAFISLLSASLITNLMNSSARDVQYRNGLILSLGLSNKDFWHLISFEWLVISFITFFPAAVCSHYLIREVYQVQLGIVYHADWTWLLINIVMATLGTAISAIWLSGSQAKKSITVLLQNN